MAQIIELDEISNITFKETQEAIDTSRWYVDDELFTEALTQYRADCDKAKAAGEKRPPITPFIAENVTGIAEAMGKRHNYVNYSYLDEMRSDAIINCCKYLHNFSTTKKNKKGKNSAFSYTGMIVTRSFNNRIEKEHREQFLKYASYELMGGNEAFGDEIIESDDYEDGVSVGILGNDFINKAREYEIKHNLGKRDKLKKKLVADTFMFDLFGMDDEDDELVMDEEDMLND